MRAALCAAIVLMSLASHAAERSLPQAEAQHHFHRGMRSYNLGEFAAAIREFKRAYELAEAPGLLFNLAQASRLNKDPERAVYYYNTYLRLMPQARNRADVEELIESCQRMVRSTETGRPGSATSATRDPRPRLPAVRESPPLVREPPRVTVPPIPVQIGLEAPPPSARRPSRAILNAGIAAGAVGLAALASGIALGVEADSAERELSRLSASGGTWDEPHRTLYRDGEREAVAAIALYAIGGAAAATGVILSIVGAHNARPLLPARVAMNAAGLQCAF
jgi:hypothetical protein